MRSLILAVVAAMGTAALVVPASARIVGSAPYMHEPYVGSGGPGDGPYWQGEPTDHRDIWRFGYYQGNDPDNFIRGQLMRDPTNLPRGR